MNKKLNYEAPEMEVVKVALNGHILQSSNVERASIVNSSDAGWAWEE